MGNLLLGDAELFLKKLDAGGDGGFGKLYLTDVLLAEINGAAVSALLGRDQCKCGCAVL